MLGGKLLILKELGDWGWGVLDKALFLVYTCLGFFNYNAFQ